MGKKRLLSFWMIMVTQEILKKPDKLRVIHEIIFC